jgi:predicted CoA-substrate-specific enzyme activase
VNLGLDIGSISVNTILMNKDRNIIEDHYTFCHGKPFHILKNILNDIIKRYGKEAIETVAITGTGGKLAESLIGGTFINEIVAQSASTAVLYPQVKTIIEMGGEDSKLIFMENQRVMDKSQLSDFAMNSICAAGTGSFLDQQARRIGVSIEKEFGELALMSEKPPRIAGRCSVFAKSDMIHLQQIATPVHDIVAGLCFALARNYRSNLARGKDVKKPVSFQGGVAANKGMVRAFREVFNLKEEELIIPKYHASMGAIGALFYLLDHKTETVSPFKGITELETYLEQENLNMDHLEPLIGMDGKWNKQTSIKFTKNKIDVYLGVDVGSLSTNVVLIDDDHKVIARRYLPTASRPLDAIRRGLKEIYEEVGDRVEVKAVGTTGSGRYLTGDFIGADTIQNEITSQATAAIDYDPEVDTVFEIGGQDSKYISIDEGVIVDFEMNKVCAAGTGSFLEEQAEKLDINIVKDFEDLAFTSKTPCRLGDRCTVFMESNLNAHQQKGVAKENLVAGLAYSIVYNYIQKVVGNKRIGNKIFFQGGVTNNKAVVSAFERVTGKSIIVPPHFDVTGAIGAAILAKNSILKGAKTRFKGFDISNIPFTQDNFTCKGCSNHCEIRRVKIKGEKKSLFYGGRCEKYEVEERKGKGKGIPNLFKERLSLLLGDFKEEPKKDRITIGIPRGLVLFYQQFNFWRTFFEELGFHVVLSKPSDRQLIKKSLELMMAETCFPVEVMHGHVLDLFENNVDYVFIPFIVNDKGNKENPTNNCNCPWIQTYPFMIKASLRNDEREKKILMPTLHFRFGSNLSNKELSGFIKDKFQMGRRRVIRAIKKAEEAQKNFEQAVAKRGKEILSNLPKDKETLVVLGRPYNTGDPELNLNLVEKLINLNVFPIPIDFLPLNIQDIFNDYPTMYWPNGQKIMAATRIVAKDDRLNAVYIGNFRCGPDTFITHFVKHGMRGKPYLHLEVDEHSADAGMITRCEAFLDSLRGNKKIKKSRKAVPFISKTPGNGDNDRVIYVPYVYDAQDVMLGVFKSVGQKAEILPVQDEKALALGRKYTNSRECFPMICITGSFIKKIMEPGFKPEQSTFFMPSHNGPCRLGQYFPLQRIIFDHLGCHDVEIFSPSTNDSYESVSCGHGMKFRLNLWRSIVAVDLLRKMLQERKPYEAVKGETVRTYKRYLKKLTECFENDAKNFMEVMTGAALAFKGIKMLDIQRKPVIAIVGEIFMRDNPFCSGRLVERLEELGAETIMTPFKEWIHYTTYRYWRDSLWKGDVAGLLKSKLQKLFQEKIEHKICETVKGVAELERDIPVKDILSLCHPYIHKDYDGEPVMVLGASAGLVKTGISGIVNLMPFTCMPGTLITAVSNSFRQDHDNIPWVNVAYDGQDDTGIETKLQAFMYQAKEYAKHKGFTRPRVWS